MTDYKELIETIVVPFHSPLLEEAILRFVHQVRRDTIEECGNFAWSFKANRLPKCCTAIQKNIANEIREMAKDHGGLGMTEIDTTNKYFVSMNVNGIHILRSPAGVRSVEDALNLAAWIVVLADPGGEKFEKIKTAIENT